MKRYLYIGFVSTALALGIGGCTPTVKVEAPDKPIHLKVDINITQEVNLKVERDVDGLAAEPAIPLAKRAGWIGERSDGYLALVRPDAPSDIAEIVQQANEDRLLEFNAIASRHNAPLKTVELVAGKKFIDKSLPGEFVQNDDGTWVRKN
ncbi:YnbE family lipoprotein [Hwanghaeella grinnelliae]|uniref:YnbE family lipoprotein n=1 Tax=Hwanghaeella grinnelliae TaxID=2500179 RepID=A0A3S2WAU1_9PROT|nr:YnbE family lipoprotein [Hwanghaeella grinnelliae]RVU38158.1 YnbE family lipoprotein [Hwanghaeella grinnelliae]